MRTHIEKSDKMAYAKMGICAILEGSKRSPYSGGLWWHSGGPLPFLCAILVTKDAKTIQNYPKLLKRGCAILVWPCLVLESSMYVFVHHFCLVLLHFPWFSLGPPVCFLHFCRVLPSFSHSFPRLVGLLRSLQFLLHNFCTPCSFCYITFALLAVSAT